MVKVTINLYKLEELEQPARERAISEHGDFLDNEGELFEDESGNMVREYPEHTVDEIVESINLNEYLFFADGKIASLTQYCGNHPKAGTIEFKLNGEIYETH